MNLAFGVLFLWLGAAFIYVASHGLEAATPWAAFQTVLQKAGRPVEADNAAA